MADIFRKLSPWLKQHRRQAWEPVTKDGDGALTDSKFSGTPLLPDGSWPRCGMCKLPMQLFLQLDLDALPKELGGRFGSGLLQFFFCTNSKSQCFIQGYGDPFAACQVVRVVEPVDSAIMPDLPAIEGYFPAKRIVRWKARKDHPALPEHSKYGLTVDDDVLDCPEARIEEYDDLDFEEYVEWSEERCFTGDKLAGWPAWKQNIEYSKCPKCRSLMDSFVFQFGSREHIPYMFADGGRGQILQCPTHKDSLGFVWASG